MMILNNILIWKLILATVSLRVTMRKSQPNLLVH